MKEIEELLFSNKDLKYKDFNASLVPSLGKSTVIGVRVPILRKLAKEIKDESYIKEFMNTLPHTYFEENQLHSFLIGEMKDFDKQINELEKFLPYIDNWAVCDSFKSKLFKKNQEKLIVKVNEWLESDHLYTKRFAINVLMNSYFLNESFKEEYLYKVMDLKTNDEYYLQMEIAWYLATAMINHFDLVVRNMNKLDDFTYKKTISKAIESYRISDEKKNHLRGLRKK